MPEMSRNLFIFNSNTMKRFGKTILRYFLFLIIAFGTIALTNFLIIFISKAPLPQTNVLIAGDSHTQCSLNPKLFKSAVNISQSAEPYVITFWKLKYILDNNKPDVLLLGFGHHNISAFNDIKFKNKIWSSELFRRTYTIQKFRNLKQIEIDYFGYYKILFKNIFLLPHRKHFNFIGHYSNSTDSNLADLKSAIERHYYNKKNELPVSEISIAYLDSIVQICNKNKINLVLINSPVHKVYYDNIPDIIKDRYNSEKKRLINMEIPVFDYSNMFYEDSLYLNADHINEKGAAKFTLTIIDLIEKKQNL